MGPGPLLLFHTDVWLIPIKLKSGKVILLKDLNFHDFPVAHKGSQKAQKSFTLTLGS